MDRCEGLYLRDVAGTSSLAVVSLTQVFEQFDATAPSPLQLTWSSPGAQPVRVRAVGLRSRLYYRMDTVRPSPGTSFRWPTDLLAALRIGPRELGITAWTRHVLANRSVDLYLPLRVTQRAQPSRPAGYRVVLWPGADLEEVYVTMTPVEADGRRGSPVMKGTPLRYGYYPAERGITVTLQPPKGAKTYVLDIGATLKNGGPTSTSIWFYHAEG
jgi:hypothetical protein